MRGRGVGAQGRGAEGSAWRWSDAGLRAAGQSAPDERATRACDHTGPHEGGGAGPGKELTTLPRDPPLPARRRSVRTARPARTRSGGARRSRRSAAQGARAVRAGRRARDQCADVCAGAVVGAARLTPPGAAWFARRAGGPQASLPQEALGVLQQKVTGPREAKRPWTNQPRRAATDVRAGRMGWRSSCPARRQERGAGHTTDDEPAGGRLALCVKGGGGAARGIELGAEGQPVK